MGFKDAMKSVWQSVPIAAYGPISLMSTGEIKKRTERGAHPIAGVTARLEQGEALQRRITATRLVTTGVFALKFRKESHGEWWLTIEGPDFFWTEKVDRKDQDKARKFAAMVNDQARKHSD